MDFAALAGLVAEDEPLAGVGGPPEAALDAIAVAAEVEVEDDLEAGAVRVDQPIGGLLAAPVGAEEGERQGVEDGRLAAAVAAGEDPEVGAVEVDDLLVAVAEEALQGDAARDHARVSSISVSAAARTASASSWPSPSWSVR